jgi:predicted NUDIX family NTP pyrophosphohydrolase
VKKFSAGILVYRRRDGQLEVLLAHHGGPFWAKKDLGAWSIIKGEYEQDEEPFGAAKREFKEETSHQPPEGEYLELGEFKRKDGKTIQAWAVEADFDPKTIKSNTFKMEWPPKSGQMQEFPENDRAEWFNLKTAATKLNTGQSIFLERLAEKLNFVAPEAKEAEEIKQQQLF